MLRWLLLMSDAGGEDENWRATLTIVIIMMFYDVNVMLVGPH